MKNLVFLMVVLAFSFSQAQGDYKYYYEILDAGEANKLYSALKSDTTNLPHWPIPTDKVDRSALPLDVNNDLVIIESQVIADKTILHRAKIKRLGFYRSGLRGILPKVKLDSLEYLGFSYENITGIDQGLSLPKLSYLSLYGCKLNSFPSNSFPNLVTLVLTDNDIQGILPADIGERMPKLGTLYLEKNYLTGPVSINLPELTFLDLGNNKFSGTITSIQSPKLKYLELTNNQFSGSIQLNYPDLESLDASFNKFTDIPPDFRAKTPKLSRFWCNNNLLAFEDLLPLAENNYERFYYGYQNWVTFSTAQMGSERQLSVQLAGAGNQYLWAFASDSSNFRKFREDSIPYYLGFFLTYGTIKPPLLDTVKGGMGNSIKIGGSENPVYYACQITNPRLPDLRMAAVLDRPVETSCWGNEDFYICLLDQGVKWGKGEKNEIKGTGLMSINDFLHFNGSLVIDTSTLKFKMDGQLYVKDIELPGGGFGNFVVAGGKYELQLGGKDGKITGFINDALKTYVPQVGGLKLKLDELSLIGGRNATGIKLSVTINIRNIVPSCGTSTVQISEYKIKGISITRPFGINVEGVEVENIGLAPGFCLKELKASYDNKEDMLSFALAVITPFIEIGGGIEFEKGNLETVELKAELQNAIIPIGPTGIGLIGGLGKISKITSPPLNVKLGGIFSAVISDDIFRLTTSMEFIPPSELKLEAGDGKLFHPPFYEDEWWLLEGGIYGSIDLHTNRLRVGGSLNAVPYEIKGSDKKFILSGSGTLSYKNYPAGDVTTGQLTGKFTVPKLGTEWPYDWMSAKIGLPYSVDGSAILVYKNTAKFISGDLDMGSRIGKVHFDINLRKRYDEEGFFYFNLKGVDLTTAFRSNNSTTIQIPSQTRLAIVKVIGKNSMPVGNLTSPGGQVITEINPGTIAEFDKLDDEHKLFVTLYSPEAGYWVIATEEGDSLEVYFTPYEYSLVLNAAAGQGSVNLSWNNLDFKSTDSIEFYVDNDSTGFDGMLAGTSRANQFAYALDFGVAEGLCEFYIYALASKDGLVKTEYARVKINNPDNGFPAPGNLKMNYNQVTGILTAQWLPAIHDSLTGYVLGLDSAGVKKVLNFLYPGEFEYRDTIPGLINPVVYLQSYGTNGLVSCPVSASASVPTIESAVPDAHSPIKIYPNPSSGKIRIEVLGENKLSSPLYIFDILGRLVKTLPVNELYPGHVFEENLNGMPEGTYYLAGFAGHKWFVEKMVVMKN